MLPVLRSSMMTKTVTSLLLWTLTSSIFAGCIKKPDQKDYNNALSAIEREDVNGATSLLENVLKRSKDSILREKAALMLSDLFAKKNDFEGLNKPLNYLSIHGLSRESRIEAKQKIADNTYFNLRNYEVAIRHYSHLMTLGHKVISNNLMVVKSYFNLNQLPQSLYEADALLGKGKAVDTQTRFELMLLKANVLFSDRNFKNAAKAYDKVLKKFPNEAKENYVLLNLAMSYEEEGFYKEAVASLIELKDEFHTPSFIEAKIKHLQSKMSYMPGARGYVK